MNDIANPHQSFRKYDQQHRLICAWSMDKISRKEGKVWVMNHFLINPMQIKNKTVILDQEMQSALTIAQKSGLPIWPLDPLIIAYFAKHPAFKKIWYHQPFTK